MTVGDTTADTQGARESADGHRRRASARLVSDDVRLGTAIDTTTPTRLTPRPRRATSPGRRADSTLLRWGVRPLLVTVDLVGFLAAVQLVDRVRGSHVVLLALIFWLYGSAGLYRSRLSLSALDDLPMLAGRVLVAAAITTTLGVLLDVDREGLYLLRAALGAAVLIPLLRAVAYRAVRRIRQDGVVAHPTLILGAGKVGGHLGELLLEHPEYGLRPVGFLDSDPLLPESERPVPLLGGHDQLSTVIVEFGIHDVVVAFGSVPESAMVDIIRTCDRLHVEIFFVPRLFELSATSREMDQVWGLPLVRLRRAAFRSPYWRVKRVIDIAIAGTALLFLSPVLAACALAVRLEGGRGIIFRQERVGLDGRAFSVLKFRSLRPVSEAESETNWNIKHDARLGPVGRFLRKTSLDELPQLWNIVRGDMSIVGPRPERPYFVSEFTRSFPRYTARHRVPAGLTGWAQVHGLRGDTSIEDRARFDNFYIENWSLWGDVKIMLRTVGHVMRGSGG